MERSPFPSDLIKAFDSPRGQGVVAFVGSGPSCHAGLPSWPELLRRVAVEVELQSQVEEPLKRGELVKVAQFLARRRSERDIQNRVAKQIEESVHEPSPLHRLIVNLPFAGIVTTNYDLLLTRADTAQRFHPPMTHLNSSLRRRLTEPFVLHVHGHTGDPGSIVITRQGYDFIELEGDKVRQFLAGVFQTRTILFIGFGFADEHIDSLLGEFEKKGALDGSSVFGLVPASSVGKEVLDENLRFRSINPIFITDSADYGVVELQKWLTSLDQALAQIKASQQRSVKVVKPPYVIDAIEKIFTEEAYTPIVAEAIRILPNRPDLYHRADLGLRRIDIGGILERVSSREMRELLIFLNNTKRNPALEDALSCFPIGEID